MKSNYETFSLKDYSLLNFRNHKLHKLLGRKGLHVRGFLLSGFTALLDGLLVQGILFLNMWLSCVAERWACPLTRASIIPEKTVFKRYVSASMVPKWIISRDEYFLSRPFKIKQAFPCVRDGSITFFMFFTLFSEKSNTRSCLANLSRNPRSKARKRLRFWGWKQLLIEKAC